MIKFTNKDGQVSKMNRADFHFMMSQLKRIAKYRKMMMKTEFGREQLREKGLL